jgi:hypothetical protein
MSENRGLRITVAAKTHEVTGDWRKLLDEELHNWYLS